MAHTIKLRPEASIKNQPWIRPVHMLHPVQLEPLITSRAQPLSPPMAAKVSKAREHYESLGAENVYLHAMHVLKAAGRGKLLDLSAGEGDRFSMALANQILYHPLSSDRHLPNTELGKSFIRRFHIHNQLRELDTAPGERMHEYVRILNDPAHDVTDLLIALYTRIADAMTIHDPATTTAASTRMPGVFPVHESWEDAKVAWAEPMLRIYCPIGDWGGQTAAYREMRDNAIRYLHPEEYARARGAVQERLGALRNTSYVLQKMLQDMSTRLDLRVLVASDYQTVSQAFPRLGDDTIAVAVKPFKGVGGLLNKHIKTGVPLDKIHDWAGATIITATQEQMYRVISFLYNGAIDAAAKACRVSELFTLPPTDYVANPKPVTRYRSVHVDTVSADPGMVPLEMIVRTVRMHEWADEGGASHDGYKNCPLVNGERRRFMQRLADITAQA